MKLCRVFDNLTEDSLNDLFFPDETSTRNPVFLSALSCKQYEKMHKALLDTANESTPPLTNLRECVDEIRLHSLHCRDMVLHVAAWFNIEDDTPQKQSQKPPLYKLFYPLFSEETQDRAMQMQAIIISHYITNHAAFTEKTIQDLRKTATIQHVSYADRFKHPPWKQLKIKISKFTSISFQHPSIVLLDQLSSKSSSFKKPSPSSNPSKDIIDCMLGSLEEIFDIPFNEFLITKENLLHLQRTLSHTVLAMIVELSPRIATFSSEECKKATGYTLNQMKELIRECQKKQTGRKSRVALSSVTSAAKSVNSHVPSVPEDNSRDRLKQ